MKAIGGGAGDFYVVPLKTQNTCCRMNLCLSHVSFYTSNVYRWSLLKCHATKTTAAA